MTEPLNAVFVYGTLKPGCRNAGWASAIAAPQADPAVLHGYALHHLGRYPAAAPPATPRRCRGFFFTVTRREVCLLCWRSWTNWKGFTARAAPKISMSALPLT